VVEPQWGAGKKAEKVEVISTCCRIVNISALTFAQVKCNVVPVGKHVLPDGRFDLCSWYVPHMGPPCGLGVNASLFEIDGSNLKGIEAFVNSQVMWHQK
jgi:hypothetical protein